MQFLFVSSNSIVEPSKEFIQTPIVCVGLLQVIFIVESVMLSILGESS